MLRGYRDLDMMKDNPFSAYGIKHLSPSSCSQFVSSPASFLLERCMGKRSAVGCAAYRGSAVEHGLALGLMNGATTDECVDAAEIEYWRLSALSADPKREKEADAIADMVRNALDEFRPYGTPTSAQGKVEWHVNGLAVPMIGFYDFEWSQHNILVDLKTTHALPSKISIKHARQVALYNVARGGNVDARVGYVTSKKVATYHLENSSEHVKALERIAHAIQNFLSLSNDPIELSKFIVPDVDSFYFNDPIIRHYAYEVWGI